MINKLNALQSMMGSLQVLQIANLASSVMGIGVTAASIAIILQRLTELTRTVEGIEEKIDALPAKWREMALVSKLVTLRTAVERLQEAEVRPDGASVAREVEEKLNYVFDALHNGICQIVVEPKVDDGLLRNLLAGLSLCGSVQIKALMWLDMNEAAETRARRQTEKLQAMSLVMPRDLLVGRLKGGRDAALSISQDLSEIRMRVSSQPSLVRTLIAREISGREYLRRIEQEDSEPYLLLPADPG